MRLLVVEDEHRLAAGLRKGLEAEGFAVDVVHNGPDGIWMAPENPFDAIVLDVMLPGHAMATRYAGRFAAKARGLRS